ncbi:COG4315 family predicted lipoprotein [Streptomyces chartreusis]|uniref:COG4315 family predicted lipoprotein n=1 Tax=Streptomyces chartreusis TaxID=1969 RepID=UPI00381DF8B4
MSLMQRLPTTLWLIGATVAVAALSPVVGTAVTDPSPGAAPALPSVAPSGTSSPIAPSMPTFNTPSSPGSEPADTPREARSTPQRLIIGVHETSLGPTAVDVRGHTLYLSVLDSTEPPQSVCVSAKCLTSWKPLYVPNGQMIPQAGKGIEQQRLGTARRPDGTWQVTLGGWPLYTFNKDTRQGDAKGEGVKGTWHAISPEGTPIPGQP